MSISTTLKKSWHNYWSGWISSPAQSAWIDYVWTFAFNTIIAVLLSIMAYLFGAKESILRIFSYNLLAAQCIGLTVHGLFDLSGRLLSDMLCRLQGLNKALYIIVISVLGIVIGYSVALTLLGFDVLAYASRAGKVILGIILMSLIFTAAIYQFFANREKIARVEADVEKERNRSLAAEKQAAIAQLKLLQAQIEPHFLFNTLAGINSLIESDPRLARQMMDALIRFLRSTLAATRADEVKLSHEIEIIHSYLEILQIRMGNRLRFRIDVTDELKSFAIPSMLLQPLVENAIKHGLEPRVEGGELTIHATRQRDETVLAVTDTGLGFQQANNHGFGLSNVRERLKLHFGEQAKLRIEENKPSGTTVSLHIPL